MLRDAKVLARCEPDGRLRVVGGRVEIRYKLGAPKAYQAGERNLSAPPGAPALLPDDYCGDVHLRLSFYKKLATAKTSEQIDSLHEEIVDRFGKLPPQGQTLIDVHRLRVLARPYGVLKVDAAPGVIHISFKKDAPIDPMSIISLVQKNKHIKLAGNDRLRIERALPDAPEYGSPFI